MNAKRCAIAAGLAFAVLWVICSALVAILPGPMMAITGHMMHGDFTAMGWTLTWTGFFFGLVGWAVVAGITAWAIALIYNRLSD